MRELTPDEQQLWNNVTQSVTPLGAPKKPGFDVPLQILNPMPSWLLDLHGFTVQEAFTTVKVFIEEAYYSSVRRVTVITGKSGAICREFPEWIDRYPVHSYELLAGGGSYRVFLKKKPQKTVSSDNKSA